MGIAAIVFIIVAILVALGVLLVTVRTSRRQDDEALRAAADRPDRSRHASRTAVPVRGTSRTGRSA